MEVKVRVPGTCGELIQGSLGEHTFHVTCPINLYSEMTLRISRSSKEIVAPAGYEKAVQALKETLRLLDHPEIGGEIVPQKVIPQGKGMASSTADIAAVCTAAATALGCVLRPEDVANIALSIEPTDGLMFPGINLFDHREGQLHEYIGEALPLGILMLDLGGQVDTVQFNSQDDLVERNRAKEKQLNEALSMVRKGFSTGNLQLLGQAATISAVANQEILPKELLPTLLEISDKLQCLGVNVAHSGTVVGLLFDQESQDGEELRRKVLELLQLNYRNWLVHMVNGGAEILTKGEETTWSTNRTYTGEIFVQPNRSLA